MEESDIIEADKKKHPNCHYSESLQKSCSQTNDDFLCETVRSVLRLCPNERPVQILNKVERSTDPSQMQIDNRMDFNNEISKGFSIFGDLLSPFGGLPEMIFGTRQNPFQRPPPQIWRFDDDEINQHSTRDQIPPHRLRSNPNEGYKPGASGSA
jgi:hypothetical protein